MGELMARNGIPPSHIQRVVYGRVIPVLDDFNIAREVVLGSELSPRTDACSVSQACITSYRAVTDAAQAIASGEIDMAIAGGADSASDVPIAASKPMSNALLDARAADSISERLSAFSSLGASDLKPRSLEPAEPSTGLTMGESTEKMAKENGITREAQDDYAHESHVRAARAWEEGRFDAQVLTLFPPPDHVPVQRDPIVRFDSERTAYADLDPVFDREHGTLTAGNSSSLSDGASALVLMREDLARAEGRPILGRLGPWAYGGVDPREQLLIGPAEVASAALARAQAEMTDMDLADIHEAFAAQVLSVLDAWDSETFARERLGRQRRVARPDPDRTNVSGGSIALGHPFAATGARQGLPLVIGKGGETRPTL